MRITRAGRLLHLAFTNYILKLHVKRLITRIDLPEVSFQGMLPTDVFWSVESLDLDTWWFPVLHQWDIASEQFVT